MPYGNMEIKFFIDPETGQPHILGPVCLKRKCGSFWLGLGCFSKAATTLE